MNGTNTQLKAYQELLAVTKWTVQMLDTEGIACGEKTAFPNNLNEFRNWVPIKLGKSGQPSIDSLSVHNGLVRFKGCPDLPL